MPNWCGNKLIITGPDVPRVLNAIGGGEAVISFKKISPIPEALEIAAGPSIVLAIGAVAREDVDFFVTALKNIMDVLPQAPMLRMDLGFLLSNFDHAEKEAALYARIDQRLESGLYLTDFLDEAPAEQNYRFTLENLVETGKMALSNIVTFGAANWYTWCVQNWGTKWDCGDDSRIIYQDDHSAIIVFDTAWSPPTPIVVRLGQQFPKFKFRLSWHEGGNGIQGRLDVHGPKVTIKDYVHYSEKREMRDYENHSISAKMGWKQSRRKISPLTVLPENIETVLAALEKGEKPARPPSQGESN